MSLLFLRSSSHVKTATVLSLNENFVLHDYMIPLLYYYNVYITLRSIVIVIARFKPRPTI